MDLRFTADELAFRDELRAFFRDNLPGDIRERMRLGHPPTKDDTVTWQRILNRRNWAAYSWPKEHGGPGWTSIQKMIFLQENQMAPALVRRPGLERSHSPHRKMMERRRARVYSKVLVEANKKIC